MMLETISRVQNPSLLADAMAGLSAEPRSLPCKWFYDETGSALFDQITEVPEYYPTRTETAILRRHCPAMAERIGPGAALIEFGSGSSVKTRLLLDCLAESLAAYVPVDISREHLEKTAERLRGEYGALRIDPLTADYTQDLTLPPSTHNGARRVVFFPGSTIGNFHRDEARAFLSRIARMIGPRGGLLIGVDLRKDPRVLEAAYDDAAGVTAAFNLNILRRLNREANTDFDLDQWKHRSIFNDSDSRIEMHLVSNRAQTVHLGEVAVDFALGESIWTESSYKYAVVDFAELAGEAGLARQDLWTDEENLFSVQWFVAKS